MKPLTKEQGVFLLMFVILAIIVTIVGWIILWIKLGFVVSFAIFLLMWGSSIKAFIISKHKEYTDD